MEIGLYTFADLQPESDENKGIDTHGRYLTQMSIGNMPHQKVIFR